MRSKVSSSPGRGARIGIHALRLFGIYTVYDVLRDPSFAALPRDLDVVELWSGVGSLVSAAKASGLQAEGFDIIRVKGVTDVPGEGNEDILTVFGFRKALSLVFRLKPGGLVWCAPVCSSFGFANGINCCRTADNAVGDESYKPVAEGNLMAQMAVFFFAVAIYRDVECGIENPASSALFRYIETFMIGVTGVVTGMAHRCAYDKGPYPRIGPKAYKFLATDRWIEEVNRRCTCPVLTDVDGNSVQHQRMMSELKPNKHTGDKQLMSKSAAYPPALGACIVEQWRALQWRAADPRHPSPGAWESDLSEDGEGDETLSKFHYLQRADFFPLECLVGPWVPTSGRPGVHPVQPGSPGPWGSDLSQDGEGDETLSKSRTIQAPRRASVPTFRRPGVHPAQPGSPGPWESDPSQDGAGEETLSKSSTIQASRHASVPTPRRPSVHPVQPGSPGPWENDLAGVQEAKRASGPARIATSRCPARRRPTVPKSIRRKVKQPRLAADLAKTTDARVRESSSSEVGEGCSSDPSGEHDGSTSSASSGAWSNSYK